MTTISDWVPLIIVIVSFLIGRGYKQVRPAVNFSTVAFTWCFILAVVWILYCLILTHPVR